MKRLSNAAQFIYAGFIGDGQISPQTAASPCQDTASRVMQFSINSLIIYRRVYISIHSAFTL